MNRYRWRNFIAKNKSGFCASVLRSMLYICAVVYGVVIAVRNFCYDKGLLRSRCAGAVVISVGNITAGGTGKTPLVVFLARLLSSMNLPLAILTRGYKATGGATADEPAVLAKSCPDAKVIVNPDRLTGARRAVHEYGARVIVMDDGFQHRRLKRNLDIVTIDATCPFGYERLLPAGLLREPTSAIRRADAVVITRTDLVSEADIDKIENRLKQIKPALAIARAVHKHTCAKGLKDRLISIEQIEKKNIKYH